MVADHAPVTFCLWPPDGQLEPCGLPALPGLLMVSPSAEEQLPFCGEHADDAHHEGWTRLEQLCDFDDAGWVGELCGQPAIGVVYSGPGIMIWSRRACPHHLTEAERRDGLMIRPLGPWSDATPEVPAHLAHLPLPRPSQPGEEVMVMLGATFDGHGVPTPITWTRVRPGEPWVASLGSWTVPDTPYTIGNPPMTPNEDYVTETEGAAMVARHSPEAPSLPVCYRTRPGVAGAVVLVGLVAFTAGATAASWLTDVYRGLAGPPRRQS